jgi:5'-3' exoribonuclease 1
MGIKHFYGWFKNRFSRNIRQIKRSELVGTPIDTLLIDMNGIIHNSAQKIYEYGSFKPLPKLIGKKTVSLPKLPKPVQAVYKDVCERVEVILSIVNPRKSLILCIDGVAPLSKQNQQRQRRFRASRDRLAEEAKNTPLRFDSNSITPGTEFMEKLSEYIDEYIRTRMRVLHPGIEIIFSSSKFPGEGEHKLIEFIRTRPSEDTYCMHGADADLIMLTLGTKFPNFYLLRDEMMSAHYEFNFINIGAIREELADYMTYSGSVFDRSKAIDDFIMMCFLVGNDFLPHIPSIEIVQGSIDIMMDVYKEVCSIHGHISTHTNSLKAFFTRLGSYEKKSIDMKIKNKHQYFEMPLIESCYNNLHGVDLDEYKELYYSTNLMGVDVGKACNDYIDGIYWVLSYYLNGVSDWKWFYPYHYAPFSSDIAKYMTDVVPSRPTNKPTTPFVQLLSVLPPSSSSLLPERLAELFFTSELKELCPLDFKIDKSGCKKEWEAVTILPVIDHALIKKLCKEKLVHLTEDELKRNKNKRFTTRVA